MQILITQCISVPVIFQIMIEFAASGWIILNCALVVYPLIPTALGGVHSTITVNTEETGACKYVFWMLPPPSMETHSREREKAHVINSSMFSSVKKLSCFHSSVSMAFLHKLTSISYLLSCDYQVRGNVTVGLTYTSLIANDIEYFHSPVGCFSLRSLYSEHLMIFGANDFLVSCFLPSCLGSLHSSDIYFVR